jgi:hypothetical protein
MFGGARVCHLVGHRRGGSGRRRAKVADKGLLVPLLEPRRRGRRLLWRRQRERGCREEGVRHRPVWGSTHGWVKGGGLGGSASGGPHNGAHLLHGKAIMGCPKEGIQHRPAGGLPMDGSKNGQAGAPTTATVTKGSGATVTVPATAPAGAPTTTAMAKGPAAPATG